MAFCARFSHRLCTLSRKRDFFVTLLTLVAATPVFTYAYLRWTLISSGDYRRIYVFYDGADESDSNASGTFFNGSLLVRSSESVAINLCPLGVPGLGPLETLPMIEHGDHQNDTSMLKAIAENNPQVNTGGWWKPDQCVARNRLAIIVPYRDRAEHLYALLRTLHPMLRRQQALYRIFVVEQAGSNIFNKARLMNIAYTFVRLKFSEYDCFIFHDVDLIPEDERNLYACTDAAARHLSPAVNELNYTLPYKELIGGVLTIRPEQFVRINGYSNLYWGWGGEDDDLYYRMEAENITVNRPSADIGRYTMIRHKKRPAMPARKRYKLVWSAKRRYKKDGLNQLTHLGFKIESVEEELLYTRILVNLGKE